MSIYLHTVYRVAEGTDDASGTVIRQTEGSKPGSKVNLCQGCKWLNASLQLPVFHTYSTLPIQFPALQLSRRIPVAGDLYL